ncbi:MAG: thioredoxin domain-containing protein, partial [Candidatus Fonsibacter sp.]
MLSLSNVLSRSKSPYLLQHRNNPVHWQLWDRSIFELSKKYNKPILLSVGYASCHWCHVMAHESFEDLETSVLMNQNFINVKVDREERPDVDFIFQTCHQIFNHRGGWPLTMFLDENGYPFMAGTYFPKEEKYGMPPFKDVLKQVSEIYSTDKSTILQQGPKFKEYLTIPKSSVTKQNLDSFIDRFISELDSTKGGFKGAPKFPILYIYDSIFHFYKKNKSPEYLKAVDLILYQLCSQGIYDQVEGGIARYSVDDQWLVP